MSDSTPPLSTTPRLYVPGLPGAGLHVPGLPGGGDEVRLEGPQAHYLGHVMRRQPGDMVRLFDGVQGEWAARVKAVTKKAVVLVLEAPSAPQETVPDLWLCFAPLKRGRIDWLVEKACELGVARLVPVQTRRTIVDRLNPERLMAHMVEAAEQCGRTALPELAAMVTLPVLLAGWPEGRALYFADEGLAGTAPAFAGLAGAPPAAILVGPEGGFTPEEAEAIRARPAARPVSLGPRILRADTAAIAAIAAWQAKQHS